MKHLVFVGPLVVIAAGVFSKGLFAEPIRHLAQATPSAAPSAAPTISIKDAPPNPALTAPSADDPVQNGPRMTDSNKVLKAQFPNATSVKEIAILPQESGGTSLMGLVARILGEGPSREHEGLRKRRFLYRVFENNKTIAVVHGSGFNINGSEQAAFVTYDAEGNILKVTTPMASEAIQKEFQAQGILDQFVGKNPENFEVVLGRKGRVKSRAAFLSQAKRPHSAEGRAYFEKLMRSLRFNTAFMDVAYFITQHPDLADKTSDSGSSVQLKASAMPLSGPEAYAQAHQGDGSNPIDGHFLLQTLPTEKSAGNPTASVPTNDASTQNSLPKDKTTRN